MDFAVTASTIADNCVSESSGKPCIWDLKGTIVLDYVGQSWLTSYVHFIAELASYRTFF